MAGLTKCVRPPWPWRPSKLRLLVDAQRSPGLSLSAFMAKHIEQPGSRHSKPASIKILSKPSASAWRFTMPEPGTTMASCIELATFLPFATTAAARKSSIRELVQEPINILSNLIASIGVLAVKPMYLSAFSMLVRFVASSSLAGSGTKPLMGKTCSGEVPQVTCGAIVAASNKTVLSKTAPSSLFSVFQ